MTTRTEHLIWLWAWRAMAAGVPVAVIHATQSVWAAIAAVVVVNGSVFIGGAYVITKDDNP